MKGCEFKNCGGDVDYAGAITILGKNSHIIENCEFKDCTGKKSGALYAKKLKNVESCNFFNCHSLESGKYSNIGIFSIETPGDLPIKSSNFFNSSVSFGRIFSGKTLSRGLLFNTISVSELMNAPSLLISNSNFKNSDIYYFNKLEETRIHKNCVFENSKSIEIEIQ